MRKLKLIIILAIVAYVVWRYLLKKPVPKIQVEMPASTSETLKKVTTDPVDFAQQKIQELQKAIDTNVSPEQQEEPIVQEVQNTVKEFDALLDAVVEAAQKEESIFLISDQAVAPAPAPTVTPITTTTVLEPRQFVSISTTLVEPAPEPRLFSSRLIKPRIAPLEPLTML